jgi:hypothetical protein
MSPSLFLINVTKEALSTVVVYSLVIVITAANPHLPRF